MVDDLAFALYVLPILTLLLPGQSHHTDNTVLHYIWISMLPLHRLLLYTQPKFSLFNSSPKRYVFVESTNYETLYNVIFSSLLFHSDFLLSNLNFSKFVLDFSIKAKRFRSKQITSSIADLCMPFTNTNRCRSQCAETRAITLLIAIRVERCSVFEFGIPKKLVRLIKMCLNETYSRVRLGKHLSDMFPVYTFTAIVDLSRSNFSIARAPLFQLKSAM